MRPSASSFKQALTASVLVLSFATHAEAEQLPIEVLSWQCEEEGRSVTIRGEVRNRSTESLNLSAVAIFRTIKGEAVRTVRGATVFSPLPGGQSSPFELVAQNRSDLSNCELAFQDSSKGATYKVPEVFELPGEVPEEGGDSDKGRSLFNGKAVCNGCHGYNGQVNEIPESTVALVAKLNPKPSNFRKPGSLKLKTNKQRFRTIKYGIPGTAMVPMTPVTDEEIIDLLAYLKTLREASTEN